MVPTRHVTRIGSIRMAGTREPAQHPLPHLLLHCAAVLGCQRGRLGELDLPLAVLGEHAIDHAAAKVDMHIQRAAEAVHKAHRPQSPTRPAATLALPRFDRPQQDVQHGTDRLRFVLQKIAQPLRYR